MKKILTIKGMSCGHCVKHVHEALTALEAVQEAVVDLESGTAAVTLSNDISEDVLREAIDEAGYGLTGIK